MTLPQRKTLRLHGYDYSRAGAYFVTICVKDKQTILGHIAGDGACNAPRIVLSKIGEIARTALLEIPRHYDNVEVDKYVIMPNHVHLLLRITERINPFPTRRCDIPNIVGKYKAAVTRRVGNAFMHSESIWQRSYHDHIIRDKEDYQKIWNYIDTNPLRWQLDCFYSE